MKRQIVIFVILATGWPKSSETNLPNTFTLNGKSVNDSCVIRTAEEVTFSEFTKAIDIVFARIKLKLSQSTSIDKNVSNNANSTELSMKDSFTSYERGIDMVLNTAAHLSQQNNIWADKTAYPIAHDSLKKVLRNIYEAIDLFNSEDLSKIQLLEKTAISEVSSVCAAIYIGIRNGRKCSTEVEGIIDSNERRSTRYIINAVNKIYAAIWTVANISISSCKETGSEDSFVTITNAQNEAVAAWKSATKAMYTSIRILHPHLSVNQIDKSNIIATLKSGRKRTSEKVKQGIEIVFRVIKSIATNVIEGKHNRNEDHSCGTEIAENETFEEWFDSVVSIMNANSLVQPVTVSVGTPSWYEASYGLRNGVRGIFEGIELVQRKNYDECMVELARIENRTIHSQLTITNEIYNAVINGWKDSDEISKVVKDAKDRALPHIVNGTISIFNGIRFLAKIMTGKQDGCHVDWSALDSHAVEVYLRFNSAVNIYYDLLESFVVNSVEICDVSEIDFAAIKSEQEVAISELNKGIKLLFTKMETDLKNIAPTNKNSLHEQSKPQSSQQLNDCSANEAYKNQVMIAIRNAVNVTLNTIKTNHLANSSAIESALAASVLATNNTLDDIFQLLDSAEGKEYTGIVAGMCDTERSSTARIVTIFTNIYSVIRNDKKNLTDKDEALIKQARSKSISHIVSGWHAMLNAIEILKTEIDSRTQVGNKDSYSAMKAAEIKACSEMEANLKVIFNLMETLILSSHPKSDEFSIGFSAIQSDRETTITKCREAVEILFEAMTYDMANVTHRNQSKNHPNAESPKMGYSWMQFHGSSTTDAAANAMNLAFKTAADAIYNAISITRPDTSTTAKTTQYGTYIAIDHVIEDIFITIDLIQHKISSGLLTEIDVMKKAAKCAATTTIRNIFIPIVCDANPGTEIYTEHKQGEKDTIGTLSKTYDAMFIGLEIFYYRSSPEEDDGTRGRHLPSMNDARNEALSTMTTAVETIFDEIFHMHKLLLTDPPTFNVTNLQINGTTTQLAIWGNCGIAVIELPKRWGKDAAFHGGKEVISCRSRSLDERLFQCSGITEVRRARWHPGSTKDCHLLILTSENTFNLYECELNGSQTLVKTWSVGPGSGSPSKIPTPASLGETAVDFDFATPTIKADIDIKEVKIDEINWNHIEWPILVLKGNGDVCTVHGNIFSFKCDKPIVTGPLTMYPSADDNYGVDSCSIICLQTTPPLVVIATSNGKLYHSILLQDSTDEDGKKSWSQYGSTFSLHTPEDALFVFECVEMELGLSVREDEKKYSCPVHLHLDRGNSTRYFCSHNAGIHVVNLPMISQLEEYLTAKDEDADLFLPNMSNQSSSQYLVCTKTKSTQEPAPILGFGLLQEPCILIALLHTGTAISLSVVDLHYLPKIKQLEPVVSPSKKIMKEPFDVYIRSILKHNVSQPILKLGPNAESTTQEVLELLLRATSVFRSEHFVRQDKVRAEIAKRTRTLQALKTYQIKELETLVEMKKQLQESAEHLAERYEDIKDTQEQLARRTEEVLRLINQRQPSMSAIEKKEANELKGMDSKIKELSQQIEKLKNKAKYQSEQLVKWDRNETKKNIVIGPSQNETIKTRLTQSEKEIADLFSKLKSLEAEVLS